MASGSLRTLTLLITQWKVILFKQNKKFDAWMHYQTTVSTSIVKMPFKIKKTDPPSANEKLFEASF